jgi:phage-related protein
MARRSKYSYTSNMYLDNLSSDSKRAEVRWMGDSHAIVKSFPKGAKSNLGYDLDRIQRGLSPLDSKPLPGVGRGVFELRDEDERAWYRVIYLKKIEGFIYVLHAFEKRTNQTSQKDLDTAKARLKVATEQIRSRQRAKKERKKE